MADDDEIDILGDFSFNSCLAQNNQGIPSCSSREDTVHPQWLLDSTVTNWYDNEREKRAKLGPSRKLSGNSTMLKYQRVRHSSWNQMERDLLSKEMEKYGRNVQKISQTLTTKTAAEIQALIEAEYGVNLDTPSMELVKNEEQDDIPNVAQEEIVTDDSAISNVLSLVATASPTITVPKKHPSRKKNTNINPKSLLKPNALVQLNPTVNPSEIYHEDDLIIGCTESVGSDTDSMEVVAKSVAKQHKEKVKAVKKKGNHRRKVSRNFDKGRTRTNSKELLKSPQAGRRKDSGASDESTKSPKLQILLGSGQALPLSEGEQVIKIEKKKDSESDSDIEVDIDSDTERPKERENVIEDTGTGSAASEAEAPIAVPLTSLGTLPKRQKKIKLTGAGDYTIAHTAAGDVLQRPPRPAPRPRPRPERLIPCRVYNADRPAPYTVRLALSALMLMEAQAHGSRAEVMGLLGGRVRGAPPVLELRAYRPARAAAGATHCDMDPVSEAAAGAWLRAAGLRVLGWHHSHPRFAAAPSAPDLRTQAALQAALEPCVALITSQHWPQGRTASQYRCFRVEHDPDSDEPIGYQLRVRLQPDVTAAGAPALLRELRALLRPPAAAAAAAAADADADPDPHRLRPHVDVCAQAGLTYLEKCISSVSHHLRSAGYPDESPVFRQLTQGLRDIFR